MLASAHDPHTPLLSHPAHTHGAAAAAGQQRSRVSSMGARDTDEAAQALTQADESSPRTPLVQYGAASDDESLLPTAGSSGSGGGGSAGSRVAVDDSASLTKPKSDPAAEKSALKRKERMAILKVIVVLVVVGAVSHTRTHSQQQPVISGRQARSLRPKCSSSFLVMSLTWHLLCSVTIPCALDSFVAVRL